MKNTEAVQYKRRIDRLFQRVGAIAGDLELQAHWARYLCVLVSGFLETSIPAVYTQYSGKCAAPNVQRFVSVNLNRFANPNMERVLQLAGSFNKQWGESLKQAVEGELKNAVDSICSNRNQIAHGRDTGISLGRVRAYYAKAVELVEIIEAQCGGG